MNVKTFIAHGASILAICSLAGTAVAQPTATAPSASAAATGPVTPVLPGPALPGVCVYSFQRLIATSAVGRSVQTRLGQIQQQIVAELQAEGTSLQNDVRAFETQRATLDPTTAEQRGSALQVRANAFQRKQQQRQREFELTQQQAVGRVAQEANGTMLQVAGQRTCSILIDDNAVLGMNAAMDITPAVVAALNARIQTIAFDRVQVNPQTGQPITGAPAAPRPATPAPR